MFAGLRQMIRTVRDRDPAAGSALEILLTYPGVHALLLQRLNHRLYRSGLRVLPRLLSHFGRFVTGIEIHPGATIGKNFFIDHGMGVVIGETTEIGDNVTMYQGVTLGGTGKEKGKRHPTVEDNVVISANASVLGSITIGHNARIGAGAVVIRDVPPDSTVVGVPGRIVVHRGEKVDPLDLHHERLPDPVQEMFHSLHRRIDDLQTRISDLEEKDGNQGI